MQLNALVSARESSVFGFAFALKRLIISLNSYFTAGVEQFDLVPGGI